MITRSVHLLPWVFALALAVTCMSLYAKLHGTRDALRLCELESQDFREQLDVANLAPLLSIQRKIQPRLSEFELRRLQRKGLINPVFDLIQDLASRADLIPAEAFFGGSMHIITGETYVLTDRWVLAGFEDGHVRGNLWLEYDVDQSGSITWRVLGWYMN
ncbi:MAG: hypothetical protein EA399_09465 [Desulfovibrionales bacterium]|nr:MAG: hypothetical protein EA399_09465 [Desulfovibrionales bacterium]